MRPIYMTMAAVAGLSVAAPASAQWTQGPVYSNAPAAPEPQWPHSRTYSYQLQLQIDAGVSEGTISRGESIRLREQLNRLVRVERRFSPNGISGPEHAELLKRSTSLAKEIRFASRDHSLRHGNQTATWESGWVNGQWVPDARFAGLRPGDRFNGDARIGQRATSRIVSLPPEYRGQYVDDARIYYGYDNGRIYQIDRQTQMILALLDIAGR